MEKYYLIKMLTNTAEQDGSTINVYDTRDSALVAYHNTLAAFINADDVLFSIVQIINGYGNIEIMEIVDHRPAPEPEPDPNEGE